MRPLDEFDNESYYKRVPLMSRPEWEEWEWDAMNPSDEDRLPIATLRQDYDDTRMDR